MFIRVAQVVVSWSAADDFFNFWGFSWFQRLYKDWGLRTSVQVWKQKTNSTAQTLCVLLYFHVMVYAIFKLIQNICVHRIVVLHSFSQVYWQLFKNSQLCHYLGFSSGIFLLLTNTCYQCQQGDNGMEAGGMIFHQPTSFPIHSQLTNSGSTSWMIH